EELVRRADLDLHDRLEHHGVGRVHALAHAFDRGHSERHFRRVHRVERPVDERDLEVDDRVAANGATLDRVAYTLLRRADVFLRHGAADCLVFEEEAAAALEGLDLEPDVTELAAATGLADEAAVDAHRLLQRLAVGDLRPADGRVDLELAQHAVDDDLE